MPEIKYKATKYIRLSDADGNGGGESYSIANQRRQIDAYIEKCADIEAVDEKIDDGYSGIIFDRPAFQEMMGDIREGRINCVIVKDLSRLGREYVETGRHLRRIFPTYGVRFIAINDDIDTLNDSADDLLVSVKSIINDAYCRDISVKTRSALSVKRSSGDYVGACAVYGYKKAADNHNKLVIDEYPANVVRDIFRLRIEGMSAARIAETLNNTGVLSPIEYKRNRGLPHPKGGYADKANSKWSATTIIRILKDETYTGVLVQGRKGTLNYKVKNLIDLPESEWARSESAHEAIIDSHDFRLARQIMRLDTRSAPGGDKVYLFSGVLICACCGGRMSRKVEHYKDKDYFYYYCPTGKKGGCHDPHRIKEEDLVASVLESVKIYVANVVSLDSLINNAGSETSSLKLIRKYDAQIDENKQQLEKVNGFKSTLYENMISGIITKDEYKSLKTKYGNDSDRLSRALDALIQERDDVAQGKSERLRWIEQFKRFQGLTTLDRKTVVQLVQSIQVLSKTDLRISFNYEDELLDELALCSHYAEVA